MKLSNQIAINAQASSGTTPVYSGAIPATSLFRVSVQFASSSGSNAGAVTLQASNDLPPGGTMAGTFTPTNWTTVPNTSQTVTAGGTVLIPATEISYQWIRVAWVPSAGAGTVTANLVALGY